jgi:hypothetical protein
MQGPNKTTSRAPKKPNLTLADNLNKPRADKLLLKPAVDILTLVNDIAVNKLEGGLTTITHSNGIAILNKFF